MNRSRVAVAAVLVVLAGVLITAAVARLDGPDRPAVAVPVVNRGEFAPSAAANSPRSRKEVGFAAGSRLVVPRFDLAADVVREAAPGGVLQLPVDPGVLGWWSGGAAPGSGHGAVVIAGHVNYAGVSGALAIVPRLQPGDRVELVRPGAASLGYRVTGVRTFAKSSGLPASLFDGAGPERLILITCGGPFDPSTGNYEDNIVAYAAPT